MCGICGVAFPKTSIHDTEEIVDEMCRAIRHRGPDDQGIHTSQNVGLGIRRLSIIDLVTGHQPIHNEDETVWVVLNGEIYNFPELKERLENKGHRFYTRSDTEVLVHLYEDLGENLFAEINGMFGLAIWDEKKNKIILARDRLGKKPLHYVYDGKTLYFASEIKSLLKLPELTAEVDLNALDLYLTYECVPAPYTIYKNIHKLMPGHYLVLSDDGMTIDKYWKLNCDLTIRMKETELVEELIERFREAVRMRLISDVPLGVFLSGGIDSSSIVAMMREIGVADIKTFNVAFEESSFDESTHARKVADYFDTDHYEMVLNPNEMINLIPEIANFLDEPLGDASIIPTYQLSKFTRQHVTVTLGGDGGDELFAGYPTYQAHKLSRYYLKIPGFLRRGVIEPLVNKLPVSDENISFDFQIKKFVSSVNLSPAVRNSLWLGSFSPEEKDLLLSEDVRSELSSNTFAPALERWESCSSSDEMQRILSLDLQLYLQDDILVKTDRASMATSLEVRAPFLDYTFVDFVSTIPSNLKLHNWTLKYIMKKAMRDKLPPGIADRKKKGFGIPVAKWLKNELRELTLDIFSESNLKKQGFFNFSYVQRLLNEHFRGLKDNRKLLWTLLAFQLWYEKFIKTG